MADALRRYTRVIVFTMKSALFLCLFLAFFGLLSITNPQLLRLSRTAGITMSTFMTVLMILVSVYGGYDIGKLKSKTIIYSLTLATLVTDIVAYFQLQIMNVNPANNARLELGGADLLLLFTALTIQVLAIVALTYLGNYVYFRLNPPEKCIIITSSREACEKVAKKIGRFRLQYRIDFQSDYRAPDLYVKIHKCDTVFLYELPVKERRDIVEFCYKNYINVHYQMDIMDVIEASSDEMFLDDVVFLSYTNPELTMEQRFVKRTFDIVFSLIALVPCIPLMLLSALFILILDGRPVIFRQERMTRGGKRFRIIKFRTMKIEEYPEETQVSLHEDDDRVTRSGRFLRRTRLDELPQFLNVLLGDMSVVGPRPEMRENVELYTRELPEFTYRLKVKAGLTGYAQISGRYNTLPKDKLIMDLMYIENYSFWQDLKLVFKTPLVLLRPDSADGFERNSQTNSVEWDDFTAVKRQKRKIWRGENP